MSIPESSIDSDTSLPPENWSVAVARRFCLDVPLLLPLTAPVVQELRTDISTFPVEIAFVNTQIAGLQQRLDHIQAEQVIISPSMSYIA